MPSTQTIFSPDDLGRENGPHLEQLDYRLLAEGDSWFSISTSVLYRSANLLEWLKTTGSKAIVSCAAPGATLAQMAKLTNDPAFNRLLAGRAAFPWTAILFSGGGNDLIDAVQLPWADEQGRPIPIQNRLLRTEAEVQALGGGSRASDYVSEAGWTALATYIRHNVGVIVERRDSSSINRDRPLLLHTYATPTARAAGDITAPRGWLHPTLVDAGIPVAMHQPITRELFGRLRALLLSCDERESSTGLPRVRVFDSAGIADLESPSSTGQGDWVNEIHLSRRGCQKVAAAWGRWVDEVLAGLPG